MFHDTWVPIRVGQGEQLPYEQRKWGVFWPTVVEQQQQQQQQQQPLPFHSPETHHGTFFLTWKCPKYPSVSIPYLSMSPSCCFSIPDFKA